MKWRIGYGACWNLKSATHKLEALHEILNDDTGLNYCNIKCVAVSNSIKPHTNFVITDAQIWPGGGWGSGVGSLPALLITN